MQCSKVHTLEFKTEELLEWVCVCGGAHACEGGTLAGRIISCSPRDAYFKIKISELVQFVGVSNV